MHRQFLRDVWGGIDDGKILIWAYDGGSRKQSIWCSSADEAADKVEAAIANKVNVFMGAGLSQQAMGENKRMLKSEVYAIAGLWLDIDIADAVHHKTNLPTTQEEAIELVRMLPIEPSYIINSGHGLQAWWLFKEPWYFRSPYERAEAADLEKRLIYFFKAKAAEHKKDGKPNPWDVDSVFNLDRIMRMPGSTNYKSKPVQAVVLERGSDGPDDDVWRYNPADFEFLPEVPADTISCGDDKGGIKIELNPSATPPFDKFNALMENDEKFAASWNKTRKDFTSGDFSMSTYDFSLARIAYAVGWTDQEVCDLIIAFRNKHNADLKMQNLQYYQRTLAGAKNEAAKAGAMQEIASHAQAHGPETVAAVDPNQKDVLLQSLSALLGVRLVQVKRYIADPPTYVLVTSRGTITLGDVDSLIRQRQFQSKVAAATGVYIKRFKEQEWDGIAQTLLSCCMDIVLEEAASDDGEVKEWLDMYLESKKPLPSDRVEEAVANMLPVKVDNGIAVFGGDFLKWLRITQQEKISRKKMGILFRSVGAIADKLPCTVNGKPSTKSVWIITE